MDFSGHSLQKELIKRLQGPTAQKLIIVGPPGIGKTTLTTQSAILAAEEKKRIILHCTLRDHGCKTYNESLIPSLLVPSTSSGFLWPGFIKNSWFLGSFRGTIAAEEDTIQNDLSGWRRAENARKLYRAIVTRCDTPQLACAGEHRFSGCCDDLFGSESHRNCSWRYDVFKDPL